MMDVKEAVGIAKTHASVVFEGEKINIEEVWFDEQTSEWCVTIGLRRQEQWPSTDIIGTRTILTSRTHYKTIRVDDATKTIKSLRNHEKMPVSPL
jgi:hypothetical protein